MVLVTLALGTLLVGLDRTVVNLAIPRLVQDFHVTISLIGWVATAYMLANAIFIPVFGKLADMYGARKVYMYGFVGFTITSVVTGFSWSIGSMIFFRALQGILGASVYPTAMALIAEHFKEKEKRAEALGAWTSIIAGSVVLGPLIGGPLIDAYSWPAAFFINLPVGIVALLMANVYLPKTIHVRVQKQFDYRGFITFASFLVSLLLLFERGGEWGWSSSPVFICMAIAIVSFISFVWLENHHKHPFIPFSILKNKVLLSVILVSLVSYGTLFGFMFLFSLYAQETLHVNATQNGFFLLPLLIAVSIVSPLGGKMLKKYKPHIPVICGLVLSALGMIIIGISGSVAGPMLVFALACIGAGIGLTSAPLSTTATTSVPHELVGFASSMLNLSRNIAGVFFVAILSILLANHVQYQLLFFLCAIAALMTLIPSLVLKRATI